jgi:hypothetical protein
MIQNIRVGPCDHKSVWLIILILQLTAVALVIGSIFTPIWATTDDGEFGLYKCDSSCSESNYKEQRKISCSESDFADDFESITTKNILDSTCKMFTNLESAFYAYIICAGGSLFFNLVWLISVLTFCSRKSTYICGIIFGSLSLISQILAIAFWISESNTKFNSCSDFPSDGKTPELCADHGIRVGIAALCVYFIWKESQKPIAVSRKPNNKIKLSSR